jgi:hypothetical protein
MLNNMHVIEETEIKTRNQRRPSYKTALLVYPVGYELDAREIAA